MLLKHATTAGQRRSSSQLTAEEDDGGAEVRKPTKFEDLHLAGAQAADAADDAIDKDSTGGEQFRHGLDPPPRHLEDFVLYNASKAMRDATPRTSRATSVV